MEKFRIYSITDANVMYKQKNENYSVGYVKSALDYKALEVLCKEFEEKRDNCYNVTNPKI